jgi:hypothetical protein
LEKVELIRLQRGHHISAAPAKRAVYDDDDPDTCRTLCDPTKACCKGKLGKTKPRSEKTFRPIRHRRNLDNPAAGDDTDAYVFGRTQLPGLISIYTDEPTTTSVWQDINAQSQAFDVGLKELIGCTTLIVVSPNGVYGSHHWEVPSFSPRIEDGVTTEKVTFDDSVIGYLKSTGADGLAAHADALAGGVAYILTPGKKLNGAANYRSKIPAMVRAIQEAVPGLQSTPSVKTYIPLEGGRNEDGTDINPADVALLEGTSRGRVLFQYDPNNNGERTMRLYFERAEIFSTNLA